MQACNERSSKTGARVNGTNKGHTPDRIAIWVSCLDWETGPTRSKGFRIRDGFYGEMRLKNAAERSLLPSESNSRLFVGREARFSIYKSDFSTAYHALIAQG